MGAGERRGLTRASGKTALPERALLFGHRHPRGPWLLLPSCPRWPPGCSGPRRAAVSVIVLSTSRQFGRELGQRGKPRRTERGGRLGARGTPGTSRASPSGAVVATERSVRGDAAARRPGVLARVGWALTRCPPFGGSRSPAGLGRRFSPGSVRRRDGAPGAEQRHWRVLGRPGLREQTEVTGGTCRLPEAAMP